METNSRNHVPRLTAIGLVAATLVACGAPVESEDIGEFADPLARENAWNLWPKVGNNYPVNVCLRSCRLTDPDPNRVETQAQCDDGRQRVETALRDYARYSRILLPQVINECANSGDRNPGWIRINFARPDQNAGGTNTLVRYVNNVKEEKSGAGYPGTGWQLRTSTGSQNNGVIRHEFGHALGFAHEYRRSDEPSGTTCIDEGVDLTPTSGSVTNLTADYDHDSIMNYSYCNSVTEFSPGDIAGLQTAYGLPFSRSFVNARWGTCMTTGTTLGGCDGATGRQIGYNLSGLLGTAAGIHKTNQTSTVLNLASNGTIQWNSNLVPGTAPSATWRLRNAMIVGLGGLCLTRGNANANVSLTKCASGDSAQTWTFDARSSSGQYRVASIGNTSLCLNDVSGTLKAVSCSNNPVPLIRFDVGNGRLRNSGNNLCMVVNGGKPVVGSTVKFVSCSTAADQQWSVRAQLENVGTGTCLAATTATGNLSSASCSTGSSRTWDFHP